MKPIKQPGRRKKNSIKFLTPPRPDPAFRKHVRDRLKLFSIDPTNSDAWAHSIGPVFYEDETHNDFKVASTIIGVFIQQSPLTVVEELFSRILAMKRKSEAAANGDRGRLALALLAWTAFVEEFGFSPRKRKLKSYILAAPSLYPSMPDMGDTKGWTRLWEDSGLQDLED